MSISLDGPHRRRAEAGRELLERVQNKTVVDVEARIGLGQAADEHRGIEALDGDDADGDHAGQQREHRVLDNERNPVAGVVPAFRYPIPDELGAEKEGDREQPISHQHVNERPLARGNAEALRTRVAPPVYPATGGTALFDGALHFKPYPSKIRDGPQPSARADRWLASGP